MGTHYRGTERQERALNACVNLLRAAEAVASRIHRHLGEERLTPSQFGALEAVCHLGPLSQGELARKLLKTAGNLTLVVDNLEKRGLVRRARDGRDRRLVRVEATAAGRRLVERLLPRHVEVIAQDFERLTRDEQAQLRRLCRKLGRAEPAE